MLVPKDMIVERLRARGDFDAVERAERELRKKVDTESDAGVLGELVLEDESDGQAPVPEVSMPYTVSTAARTGQR